MIDPNRPSIKSLLDDIENRGKLPPWAMPGGYPIIYIDGHNEVLCPDCAQKELEEFATLSAEDKEYFDKRDLPVDWMIHYEGPPEYCVECNKEIPSAYSDPDLEEEGEELFAIMTGSVPLGSQIEEVMEQVERQNQQTGEETEEEAK